MKIDKRFLATWFVCYLVVFSVLMGLVLILWRW